MTNHLHDALFGQHAANDATFLMLPDGARISFCDFVALAARHAHALRRAGLMPGDRVALHLEKSPHMLAVIAGAIRAGVGELGLIPGSMGTGSYIVHRDAVKACALCPQCAIQHEVPKLHRVFMFKLFQLLTNRGTCFAGDHKIKPLRRWHSGFRRNHFNGLSAH